MASDLPLKKITINLYEADVEYAKDTFTTSYQRLIRELFHRYCTQHQRKVANQAKKAIEDYNDG